MIMKSIFLSLSLMIAYEQSASASDGSKATVSETPHQAEQDNLQRKPATDSIVDRWDKIPNAEIIVKGNTEVIYGFTKTVRGKTFVCFFADTYFSSSVGGSVNCNPL